MRSISDGSRAKAAVALESAIPTKVEGLVSKQKTRLIRAPEGNFLPHPGKKRPYTLTSALNLLG
jgi:hypothetical protein